MMMKVVIEKDVPIPSGQFSFLQDMAIGDSVLLDNVSGLQSRFSIESRRYGIKVKTRTLDDGNSLRVWRVE